MKQPDFGGLEFRKLLGRFIDVCQAIEYAHSRGVLHRDLKPGNIMLGKYGETLVVDWGLAKAQASRDGNEAKGETTLRPASASGSAPTMMGSAIGTPAFMPPEQAAGDLDRLGPASDVYSLGATLYYLITGSPPFQGKDLTEILERVKAGEFRSPRSVQAQAPKILASVCLKAMSRQPESRYATPQDLADDVERFLADEPVQAFREPALLRIRRWLRNHQTLAVATSAVLLVSAIGLSVFSAVVNSKNATLTRMYQSIEQKNESLDRKNVQLIAAEKRANNERDEKARTSAKLAFDKAEQLSIEGDIAAALHWYLRAEELSPPTDKDFHDLIRANVGSWQERLIRLTDCVPTAGGDADGGQFSPDGSTVYLCRPEVGVMAWDTRSGDLTNVFPFPDSEHDLEPYIGGDLTKLDGILKGGLLQGKLPIAISFQQSTCVVGRGNRLFAWKLAEQAGKAKEIDVPGSITSIGFHPSENHVLIGTKGGKALLFDLNEGRQLGKALEHGSTVSTAVFSPAGDEVLTGGYDGIVRRWNVESREQIEPEFRGRSSAICAAYSPDGKRIVVGHDLFLMVWDRGSGDLLLEKRIRGEVVSVAFSQDGRRFAIALENATTEVWDAQALKPLAYPMKHATSPRRVALGPDGSRLSSLSMVGSVRTWHLPEAADTLLDTSGLRHGRGFAVSPKGDWVAVGNIRGQLQLRRLSDGKIIGEEVNFGEPIASLGASPDGDVLFVGGFRGTGRAFDTGELKPLADPYKFPSPIMSCTFVDAGLVAVGTMSGEIPLLNFRARETVAEFKQSAVVSSAAAGKVLATTGHDITSIRFWNISRREEERPPIEAGGAFHSIVSDAGGRYFAAASDTSIQVWSNNGELVTQITDGAPFRSIALRADGRCLAATNDDLAVRFWHLPTGKPFGPRRRFIGCGGLGFDPSGRLIAAVTPKGSKESLLVVEPPKASDSSLATRQLRLQIETGVQLNEDYKQTALFAESWRERRQQLSAASGLEAD